MWSAGCVYVLLASLAAAASALGATESAPESERSSLAKLRLVCRNKKVEIGSLSEMGELIRTLASHEPLCPDKYLSAFYELGPLVAMRRVELCDAPAIDRVKSYHFRFIQPPRRANRPPTQFEPTPRDLVKGQLYPEPRKYTVEFDHQDNPLVAPVAVRHFFLAFALQLSAQCKRNLLVNLEEDSARFLSANDRDVMLIFDRETPIGRLMVSDLADLDFDSVLHIAELDGPFGGDEPEGAANKRIFLKTTARANSALYDMVLACTRKFKAVYDKLFMPVVVLSKLGYDYLGEDLLSARERGRLAGDTVKSWLGVVHVCEMFQNVVLARVPAELVNRRQLGQSAAELEEGQVERLEGAERLQLEGLSPLELGRPADYEMSHKSAMADRLAVVGERRLALELAKKRGHRHPFGFRGFVRRFGGLLKRALASLDLSRFAHYRRNSLWYSGALNFISSLTNVASIATTVAFTVVALV